MTSVDSANIPEDEQRLLSGNEADTSNSGQRNSSNRRRERSNHEFPVAINAEYQPFSAYESTGIIRTNTLMKGSFHESRLRIYVDSYPVLWITFFIIIFIGAMVAIFGGYTAIEQSVTVQSRGAFFTNILNWINSASFLCFSFVIVTGLTCWVISV